MKHFAPVRVRIEKDIITRVVRKLQGKGAIAVKVGQQVSPDEIIGSFTASSGFRTLNISTLLDVPPQQIEKYLNRQAGQRIYKDELLALRKRGLFGKDKAIVSPADGIVDFIDKKSGDVKISFLPKKTDLPAGIYGIVEEIDEQRGEIVIRTQVSRIFGVLGSGKSRDGILHLLGKKDELITKEKLKTQYEGKILVGGSLFFKEAISLAISARASGIITGGINAPDFKGMSGGRLILSQKSDSDVGISLVACEGFGSVAIGDDIFGLLVQYAGRFVFIDGYSASVDLPSFSSSSLIKIRSTQLPKMQNNSSGGLGGCLLNMSELKVGMGVRIIGNSYLGEQGKLLKIDDLPTLLPSGIKAHLATVETPRRKLQVPVANLEIMV